MVRGVAPESRRRGRMDGGSRAQGGLGEGAAAAGERADDRLQAVLAGDLGRGGGLCAVRTRSRSRITS
jgi:hypothetical protein